MGTTAEEDPAHVGIHGNNVADSLAKAAHQDERPTVFLSRCVGARLLIRGILCLRDPTYRLLRAFHHHRSHVRHIRVAKYRSFTGCAVAWHLRMRTSRKYLVDATLVPDLVPLKTWSMFPCVAAITVLPGINLSSALRPNGRPNGSVLDLLFL